MFDKAAIIKMIPLRVRENIKYFLKKINETKLVKSFRAHKIKKYLENIFKNSKNLDDLDSSEIHQKIVELYCLTSGRALDQISNGLINDSKPISGDSKYFSNFESKKSEIVSSINEKGFYLIESVIPKNICELIVDYALKTECFPRPADGMVSQKKALPAPPFQSARYDFSPDRKLIFENEILQELIFDPFIFRLSQEYLGGKPYLEHIEMWWYFPYEMRDDAWAENYHFDLDSLKWIKFFINFEDIHLENGPHCFIEGSHKAKAIPVALLSKGYARLEDSEVFESLPNAKEHKFVVPAGSILIEDTRGLHKGLSPISGRRLLFQIEYSSIYVGHNKREKIGSLKNVTGPMCQRFLDSYESYAGHFSSDFLKKYLK